MRRAENDLRRNGVRQKNCACCQRRVLVLGTHAQYPRAVVFEVPECADLNDALTLVFLVPKCVRQTSSYPGWLLQKEMFF